MSMPWQVAISFFIKTMFPLFLSSMLTSKSALSLFNTTPWKSMMLVVMVPVLSKQTVSILPVE